MSGKLTLTKNDAIGIGIDRRRRVRRELANTLVDRAKWLPQPDRALVEAVFGDGKSIAEIWELGILASASSHAPTLGDPRTSQKNHEREVQLRRLRRHLARLIKRLTTPRFAYVAAGMDTWPATRRRVAMACVLRGHSIRKAARELDLSFHTVRQNLQRIDAICDAAVLVRRQTTQAAWRQSHTQGDRR